MEVCFSDSENKSDTMSYSWKFDWCCADWTDHVQEGRKRPIPFLPYYRIYYYRHRRISLTERDMWPPSLFPDHVGRFIVCVPTWEKRKGAGTSPAKPRTQLLKTKSESGLFSSHEPINLINKNRNYNKLHSFEQHQIYKPPKKEMQVPSLLRSNFVEVVNC